MWACTTLFNFKLVWSKAWIIHLFQINLQALDLLAQANVLSSLSPIGMIYLEQELECHENLTLPTHPINIP